MVDRKDVRSGRSTRIARAKRALMAYIWANPIVMTGFVFLVPNPAIDHLLLEVAKGHFNCTAMVYNDVLPNVTQNPSYTAASLTLFLLWFGSLVASLFSFSFSLPMPSYTKFLTLQYRLTQIPAVLSFGLFAASLCYLLLPTVGHIDLELRYMVLAWAWALLSAGLLSYGFSQIDPLEFATDCILVPRDNLREVLNGHTYASDKQVAQETDSPVDGISILESLSKELKDRDDVEPDDAINDLLDTLDKLLSRDVRSILHMSFLDLSSFQKKPWRIVCRIAAEWLQQEIDNQQCADHIESPLIWSTHMEYALLILLSTCPHELAQEPAAVLRRCMAPYRIRPVLSIITPRISRGLHSDIDILRVALERLRVREVLVHYADLTGMNEALRELIQEYLCHHEHDHATIQAHFEAHRDEMIHGGITDIIMPMFVRALTTRIHPDIPYTWAVISDTRILATFWSPDVSWSSSALELFRETFRVIPHAYILIPNLIPAAHENFDELSTQVVKTCFLQGRAADQYYTLETLSQILWEDWRTGGLVDSDPYQETTNPVYPVKFAKLCLTILSSMDQLPVPGTRSGDLWSRLWENIGMALARYSRNYIVTEDRQIVTEVVQEIRTLLGTGNVFDSPEEWAVSYQTEEGSIFPKSLLDSLAIFLRPENDRPRTVLSRISSRASSPTRSRPATPGQGPVEITPIVSVLVDRDQDLDQDDMEVPSEGQDALQDHTIVIVASDDEDNLEQD